MTGAADHVVVHRCTVRVVRHGGWSWGADPSGLVDRITGLLPQIIAEHLDGIDPEAAHLGLDQPVRIVVPLRAGELLSAGRAGSGTRVARPAAAAVPATSAPAPAAPIAAPATPTPSFPAAPGDPEPPFAEPPAGAALLRFLVDVANRGELAGLLALLPLATLEAWHRVLLPSLPPPDAGHSLTGGRRGDGDPSGAVPNGPVAPSPATLAAWRRVSDGVQPAPAAAGPGSPSAAQLAALARAAAAARDPSPRRDRRLRAELAALASLAAGMGPAAALRVLAQLAADGQPPEPIPPTGRQRQAPAAAPATLDPRPDRPTRSADNPAGPPPPVEVCSVLPFLLLGPLSSSGYLQTIAPALRAAGLEQGLAAFATTLAYTVLGPLERGWRRRPADLTAAAAFAGLAAPEPDLAEFARRVPAALPALDALLAGALAQGHTAGQPLLLAGTSESLGGGLVLADREGLFPIAWVDEVDRLLPLWRGCGSPLVLVGPEAATTPVLGALQEAGVRFVVGVPPRDERWRRLRLPQALWTNDQESSAAVLARQAAGFRLASERLGSAVHALAGARDPVPLASGPALRRSLTLAAGMGLATIAWTLWREREATDPLLSLERFGDLSGWVSFDADRVRVRLPLGRRHADLLRHGLLAEVRGVPWLAGRVLELSGG